jgi:hypothetical protein
MSAAMFRAVVVKLLVRFGGCCPRNLHSPVSFLELILILYDVIVDQSVDCPVIPRNRGGIGVHEILFILADFLKWHFLLVDA